MRTRALTLLVSAGLLLHPGEAMPAARANPPKLYGLAYGAFRSGQSPLTGVQPSKAEIGEDMKVLKHSALRIRTYSVTDTQQLIPLLARKAGIGCYAGAHIGSDPAANADEIERLLEVAASARPLGLVVGNEVLLHGSLSVQDLIALIRTVKSDERVVRRGIPVGYAGVYGSFLDRPDIAELVAELDFLMIHVHPYWDGLQVGDAATYVREKWLEVSSAYPDKVVIIGETGWPTAGDSIGAAVPGEANQQEFLKQFVTIALREDIPYFIFEAFDEEWKEIQSGVAAEGNWGLWYPDRAMKPRRFLSSPPPLVDILRTPRCGAGPDEMDRIAGRVYGVNRSERSDYRVVVYARTNKWYVQPFEDRPLTLVRPKLSWSNRTHLGDLYATLLVRAGYAPALTRDELPTVDGEVVAISVKNCE